MTFLDGNKFFRVFQRDAETTVICKPLILGSKETLSSEFASGSQFGCDFCLMFAPTSTINSKTISATTYVLFLSICLSISLLLSSRFYFSLFLFPLFAPFSRSSPERGDIPAELRFLPDYRGPDRMAGPGPPERQGRAGRVRVSWTRKDCV